MKIGKNNDRTRLEYWRKRAQWGIPLELVDPEKRAQIRLARAQYDALCEIIDGQNPRRS